MAKPEPFKVSELPNARTCRLPPPNDNSVTVHDKKFVLPLEKNVPDDLVFILKSPPQS